jgi:hypothetical protein
VLVGVVGAPTKADTAARGAGSEGAEGLEVPVDRLSQLELAAGAPAAEVAWLDARLSPLALEKDSVLARC